MLIVFQRLVLLGVFWLVLTGGDVSGWVVGAIAAGLATAISLRLLPPGSRRVSPLRAVVLLPGFLMRSLAGGLDVAWRALHPRMPLDPGWISYSSRLPAGLARVSLGGEVSLMPGTLVAGSVDERLYIHCLDQTQPVMETLRNEERRIGAVLREADEEHA